MEKPNTYLAIDLEPDIRDVGGIEPLHITVTPPARIEEIQLSCVIEGLHAELSGTGEFEVRGGDIDYFGPHKDPVKVRKMKLSEELQSVHDKAIRVMHEADPTIDMTYAGDNYQPHSTYQHGKGIAENEKILVSKLTLFRKFGAEWLRIAQIGLRSDDETAS